MFASAALPRDALMPRGRDGMRAGLGFALLAHALLIAGLTFSLNWRASDPEGVEAELWSSTPQIAAPKAAEPVPTPPPKPEPRPEPRPEPKPEPVPKAVAPPPPAPDPQIAIEQERKRKLERQREKEEEENERQKALEKQRRKQELVAKDAADKQKRLEAEKLAQQREQADAKKKQADQKAQEQRLALQREANLKRMMGQADGSTDAGATGTAAKTSGPSAGYAGRIKARIKSNMSFPDTVDGNPAVEVVLKLAPDGTILSSRIVKPSGSPEWDAAVLRAIEKTAVLPRDTDGRVQPTMLIVYQPKD